MVIIIVAIKYYMSRRLIPLMIHVLSVPIPSLDYCLSCSIIYTVKHVLSKVTFGTKKM